MPVTLRTIGRSLRRSNASHCRTSLLVASVVVSVSAATWIAPPTPHAAEEPQLRTRSLPTILDERDDLAAQKRRLSDELQATRDAKLQIEQSIAALEDSQVAEADLAKAFEVTKLMADRKTPIKVADLQSYCLTLIGASDQMWVINRTDQSRRHQLKVNPAIARLIDFTPPDDSRPMFGDDLASMPLQDAAGQCRFRVLGESVTDHDANEILSSILSMLAGADVARTKEEFSQRKGNLLRFWQRGNTKLQAQMQELDAQLRTLEEKIVKNNAEIDDAARKIAAQSQINDGLIWATWGMVGALFALGLALMFARGQIATVIIENRTIVELISIGFLLVTVIILGVGDKLRGEALGALLGTIAGYVFGREMQRARVPVVHLDRGGGGGAGAAAGGPQPGGAGGPATGPQPGNQNPPVLEL